MNNYECRLYMQHCQIHVHYMYIAVCKYTGHERETLYMYMYTCTCIAVMTIHSIVTINNIIIILYMHDTSYCLFLYS